MKKLATGIAVLLLAFVTNAEELVIVDCKFIEHPTNVKITKESLKNGSAFKKKGVQEFVLERGETKSGQTILLMKSQRYIVPAGGAPEGEWIVKNEAKAEKSKNTDNQIMCDVVMDMKYWKPIMQSDLELRLEPIIRANDMIDFSGKALIREKPGLTFYEKTAMIEFGCREYYIGGTVKNGELIILEGKPSDSRRRITILLTLTKKKAN